MYTLCLTRCLILASLREGFSWSRHRRIPNCFQVTNVNCFATTAVKQTVGWHFGCLCMEILPSLIFNPSSLKNRFEILDPFNLWKSPPPPC